MFHTSETSTTAEHAVSNDDASLTNKVVTMDHATMVEISSVPGSRYRVVLVATSEVLIERARDPEFEAARILQARGFAGMMETRWSGSDVVSFRMTIEAAANLTTSDPPKGNLRIGRWQPFDCSVFSKAEAEEEVTA